jgi:hypothetical protein
MQTNKWENPDKKLDIDTAFKYFIKNYISGRQKG